MPINQPFYIVANHRITALTRDEVKYINQVNPDAPYLSQELVNTRAQLATLRWAATADHATVRERILELPRLVHQAEQVKEAIYRDSNPSSGPAQEAVHHLILCLHGQETALNYVWMTQGTSFESEIS